MPGCAYCQASLDIVANQVGRRDTCPACEAEIHTCRCCRHFDPQVAKACKEPFAEVPSDKDAANFCEYFQLGEGGLWKDSSRDAQRALAEALFKKP